MLRLVLGTNNVFALPDGDGLTLIDAGPDYEGAWEDLIAQLTAYGHAPGDVHTVVLTHHHLDHAGLAARWQAAGARILIGRDDATALALDDQAWERERALGRATLLRHGVPPAALTASGARGERYTRWPAPLRITAVTADGVLDDNDRIAPAGRALRVVACPGHTPGTVLLLDEATGAVFTGDHLLPRMAPTSGIQFDGERRRPSLPVYLASLHKARKVLCASIDEQGRATLTGGGAGSPPSGPSRDSVYPGHGEPMPDLAEAVGWTVRLLEQRARRALTHLRYSPATAYELALRMFPHLGPRHLRPVMAETLGLLDLLTERGQAATTEADTLIMWTVTSPGLR